MTTGTFPDIRVSEGLGTGFEGRGLRWAEVGIPVPAWRHGEDPEGGLRGPETPDQWGPAEPILPLLFSLGGPRAR